MKTIGIIASCDTKYQEVQFMRRCLQRCGCTPLVLDMAVGLGPSGAADIPREEVFQEIGLVWEEIRQKPKGDLVVEMTRAMEALVLRLYREGKIQGLIAAGGVQNTMVATNAMRALPLGFPKMMATTIACGQKVFGDVVGTKDVVTMPSISDFTGINSMTRMVLTNACACVAGMVQYGAPFVKEPGKKAVGVTLMGITNEGCCAAVEELERLGIEAIGFHSTGVGGTIMEQMAAEGQLDGILDMTTHEITAEYFGGGFSYGAKNRLVKPLEQGLPMIVSVGGLDFVDFDKDHFPPRMEERVYNMHNGTLAHIKILPDEAEEVGAIFARRLNHAVRPVRLVLPTEGMRKNTRPGENLYCKETDEALIGAILKGLTNPLVTVEYQEGNINDAAWGREIARKMAAVLNEER